MEVIKCNTKVAMATTGEARNINTKSKMAESWFASSDEIVVDQLKLNAKNKNTTKSTQTWLNVWEKWANEKNSTLNWRSTSMKISIKSYKCFTLKYAPKIGSFIILRLIL